MPETSPKPPFEPSYTIDSFCEAENFTKPYYFKLKKEGRGPREMRDGRLIRITHKARLDWQKEREKWSAAQAQIDEILRARARTANAKSLASPKHISKRRGSAR
jgi:hypothetical protein